MGARGIVGAILEQTRSGVSPVVISETPRAILPPTSGPIDRIGPGGSLPVSKEQWPEWSLEPILETRPGRIPDPYPGTEAAGVFADVVLGDPTDQQPTESQEDDAMAHDWGHLLRQGITEITGIGALPGNFSAGPEVNQPAGFATTVGPPVIGPSGSAQSCEPCGPRYLTYDCKTGKLSKKRRRGKPRLATNRDLSDLAAIVAITGKGSAMNQAVAAMVRR